MKASICKKLCSLALVLALPVTFMPVKAFAAEGGEGTASPAAVATAAELETALANGQAEILLTSDLVLDRTFYVTADTVIRSDEARTLTRSADFGGDLFAVGVSAEGGTPQEPVTLTLGTKDGSALTFDGNKANLADELSVNGTVLYVTGGSNVTVNNCVSFKNNRKDGNVRTVEDSPGSAESVGGSAVIAASGSVALDGVTFENNESSGEGGAVYFAADTAGTVSGAQFKSNKASGDNGSGGALALRSAEVSLSEASFEQNEAAKNGGALFISYTSAAQHNASVTAESCSFTENTSANYGGAVYTASFALDENNRLLSVSDTVFGQNSAAVNGGAVYMKDSNVFFTSAEFSGNTASSDSNGGGALYSSGSIVEIDGAGFTGNSAVKNGGAVGLYSESKATLHNVTANGNSAGGNGGFIYNSSSELNVYDSTLSQNTSGANGGAAALHSLGTSGFYNTVFDRNTANNIGGALYDYTGASTTTVHSCSFTDNTSQSFGGAVYASNACLLNIYNSAATGNSASNGAVLYLTTTGTTVTLNGLTVSENTASVSGPIIYGNTTKSILKLNKANYTDSGLQGDPDDAYWAGAVANKVKLVEITDDIPGYLDYYGNYVGVNDDPGSDAEKEVGTSDALEAALNAGLDEIEITADFELDRTFYVTSDTRIYSNGARTLTRAPGFGGDLFVVGAYSTGETTQAPVALELGSKGGDALTFNGGKSSLNEGLEVSGTVIYVKGSSAVTVNDTVSFNNNLKNANIRTVTDSLGSAESVGGSAVIVASGSLTVDGASFENNDAAGEGGAVYLAANTSGSFNGASFNANNATGDNGSGGAIALRSAVLELTDTSFEHNTSTKNGGAVFVSYTSAAEHNSAVSAENCEFISNTCANNGGALYNTSYALDADERALNISGSEFDRNTATGNGGAVYVTGTNAALISSVFTSNSATNGGAVGAYSQSKVAMNDIGASGNQAGGNGGFVYNSGSELNVYDSTLSENAADSNGGAASLHSSGVSGFYNTIFSGNRALKNGGALYDYTGASETVVHSCTFNDNTAAAYGGAMQVSNASLLKVFNSAASGNSASNGGAVYLTTTATAVTLNGFTVSQNTASAAGPIIFGNTAKATLNINKQNYKDSDLQGEPDQAYWAEAVANKVTVKEITDEIPGYYDFYGRYHAIENAAEGVTDVTSSAELEAAIDSGAEMIRVTGDFELDRTFYITGSTTIYASSSHTLTRAADFGGDIFVIGESKDGAVPVNEGIKPVLNLGDPEITIADLLTIDGNKDNMTVGVTGTVFFTCFSATVNINESVSVINHRKTGNERTYNEKYSLPYTNRIGGAVAVTANGTLNIFGGKFTGNEVNDENTAQGADESERDCSLGAVIFNFSNLNIFDGLFKDNQAARGGVVYNYRMTRISGGVFKNNTATKIGGAVYLADSQYCEVLLGSEAGNNTLLFEGNSSSSVGGAIFAQTKNALIIYGNTVFKDNSSTGSNGGAICCYGTLTVKNAEFENNFAYQRGGAVYVSNANDTLTTRFASFDGVTFKGNSANRGGALGIYASSSDYSEGGNATVTGCTFENNSAVDPTSDSTATDVFGGAIYLGRIGTLNIVDSALSGNTALEEGGAIYITGESKAKITGSELTGNTVTLANNGNGGAVSIHSSYLDITDTDFGANSATKNGGALYISFITKSAINSAVTFNGARFNGNSSENSGGAVYVTAHDVEDPKAVLSSEGSSFINNHSPRNGGAMYVTGGAYLYMHDSTFRGNTSDALANSSGSRYGGGALFVSGAEVEINKASFENNTSAYNGGAAALYSEGALTLNDATASGNSAANNGGFAYVNGSELNAYSCTFTGNTAKGGGAINIYTDGKAKLCDSSFTGNSATNNGGALYIYTGGTGVTAHNCSFDTNAAANYGGAIYASSASIAGLYNTEARGNSASQGGFMYETAKNTSVTVNSMTVSGNTAADAGPIIFGNSAKAVLNINKTNYSDSDVQGELDADYWATAIAGELKVVEITGEIPEYEGYSREENTEPGTDPSALSPSEAVFELAEHSSDGLFSPAYESYPRLDTSSNFMSLNTTEYSDINGRTVTVDAFVNKPNVPYGNPNFAQGLLIYQAMLYKKNHPSEPVSIDISSFRFSVDASVCINRNSRYFGYMRNLPPNAQYDKYGFVRISYLLIAAAGMGINVNVIGQMDAYPRSTNVSFKSYFTGYLDSACDEAYAPGHVIRDYLSFNFCYWTSYGDDAATDMMHTKICAVSNYTDMNGTDHEYAVWSSSANIDGVTAEGCNGNNKVQTGSIVSGHRELYEVSRNYLRLISQYCGQEDVYLFRELVIRRTTDQIKLINEGKWNDIPENDRIVYLGTENDKVFELYFTPFGGDAGVWDEVNNPYCKYIGKLSRSDDSIWFIWNNANFLSYPLSDMLLNKVCASFHNNKSPENRLFILLLGTDTAKLNQSYSDLVVGRDIGSVSLNKHKYSGIHNKDIQLSYSENGKRSYVTLLNSLNIHGGSMSYQSNFVLVVKEDSCRNDSVFYTFADQTSNGIISHSYGELKTMEATGSEHAYTYRECSECGDIRIESITHVPSDIWVIDKAATAEEKGIRHRECSICGETVEAGEYTLDALPAVKKKAGGTLFTTAITERIEKLTAGALTFEATVHLPKTYSSRGGVIIGNYGSAGDVISLETYFSGKLRLFTHQDGSDFDYRFKTDIRSDRPVHIALAVDGTEAKLYIDGSFKESVTLDRELPEVTEGYVVGGDRRYGNDQYFKGRMYSAALFSDVRTAQEIAVDRLLVTSDADSLIYSKSFGTDEELHTPGEWITDCASTEQARGIRHRECTDCGKVLEIEQTPRIISGISYDYTGTSGMKTAKNAVDIEYIGTLRKAPKTFEATLRLPKSYNDRAGVIVGNYGNGLANQMNLEIAAGGKVRLFYTADGTDYNCYFSRDVRSDAPVHLALTVDGITATLYINGVKDQEIALNAALPEMTSCFSVAGDSRTGNTQYFKGELYSVSLFSDVRTAREIALDRILTSTDADNLIYSKYYDDNTEPQVCDHEHTETAPIVDLAPSENAHGISHTECSVCGRIVKAYETCFDGNAEKLYSGDAEGRRASETPGLVAVDKLSEPAHTFEATIRLPKSVDSRGGIIIGNYGVKGDIISLEAYNGGKFRLYCEKGGVINDYRFKTDIRSDRPLSLALTVEDRTAKLYLDGTLKETVTLKDDLPEVTDGYIIGADQRSGDERYFKGTIRSAALFSDVRTEQELAADRIMPSADAENLLCLKILDSESAPLSYANDKLGSIGVTPLTLEADLRLSPTVAGRGGVIAGNYSTYSAPGTLNFEIYSLGRPRLFYTSNNRSYDIVFNTDIRSDSVVKLALVIDGLTAKLYTDGNLAETKNLPALVPAVSNGYKIGYDNRSDLRPYFKGELKRVALFSDVRSDSEIAADAQGIADDEQGLLCQMLSEDSHTPGEWIIDLPAGEGKNGVCHKECSGCGEITEIAEIPSADPEAVTCSTLPGSGKTFTSDKNSLIAVPSLEAAPHTFEAVFRLSPSMNDRAGCLISNYGNNNSAISFEIQAGGKPRIYIVSGSSLLDITFKTDIRSADPVHVAVTLENSTACLYVNGELKETAALTQFPENAVDRYCVGGDNRPGNTRFFTGELYGAALFSDVRTPEEIALDSVMVTSDAQGLAFRYYAQ